MATQEQERIVIKRVREDLEEGNSQHEIQQKERSKKKKKKERRADEVQQADSSSLHSSELQAEVRSREEKNSLRSSQDQSFSQSEYVGKATHVKDGALNGKEDEDRQLQEGILHRVNGKKEKTKKKLEKNREDALEGGDLDGEVVMVEETAEKKRKKKKKERNIEQLDGGNIRKDIAEELEQDQNLREEETEENGRKKEKNKKKRKTKEVEDESGWHYYSKGEEEEEQEERPHSPEKNVMLLNGVNTMESVDSAPSNLNRDPIAGETDKQKKKEKKRKRVTFDDHIVAANQEQGIDALNEAAVSTSIEDSNPKDDVEEIWGVRFSPEEDAILKDAVWRYIKSRGWDEHIGLQKVFNSKKNRDARDCWAEIKMSLPHRPRQAVRFRARLLLESGAHLGRWSKEEEDILMRLQKERGHKWREISGILNRHRASIKEKWRSLKRSMGTSKKRGGWTQEELQLLSDMVHKSLRLNRLKAARKEKPDRHLLRDNIAWEQIANTLGTHNHGPCCSKWYYNLQSSLVSDGQWANQDDFFLIRSLLESGASAEEEVEWDKLLEHRSGQICLMRWKQMVKHLGENRTRQFLDKLDILARRYAPELLETSAEDNSNKELPVVTAQAS